MLKINTIYKLINIINIYNLFLRKSNILYILKKVEFLLKKLIKIFLFNIIYDNGLTG